MANKKKGEAVKVKVGDHIYDAQVLTDSNGKTVTIQVTVRLSDVLGFFEVDIEDVDSTNVLTDEKWERHDSPT